MPTRPEHDHAAFLVGDIARHFRALFEQAIERAEIGLTTSEARVLGHVSRCGRMRQNCLADSLGVAPMSLSVFLDGLESKGLIRREADSQDRRAKVVALTPASEPVLERIGEIGRQVHAEALAELSAEDQAQFHALATRLRQHLETLRGFRPQEAQP